MAAGVEAAGHIVWVEEADRQITVQPNCSVLLNSGAAGCIVSLFILILGVEPRPCAH